MWYYNLTIVETAKDFKIVDKDNCVYMRCLTRADAEAWIAQIIKKHASF